MIGVTRNLCMLAASLIFGAATAASAATIRGLGADNTLVAFDTERRAATETRRIAGVAGTLIGIDYRPKDGRLYGIDDRGTIYAIDTTTAIATRVSRIDKPFDHGGRALVDFNPQADRLRLIGVNGTSLRVNVETGAVAVDGSLRYDAKDRHAGKTPRVTMGAYTNSMADAKGTELFNVDTDAGTLVLQSPPNDGVLQTRAETTVRFSPRAAMDIVLTTDDDNVAYVLDGATLYTVELRDGKVTRLGDVTGLPALIDIAVQPLRR